METQSNDTRRNEDDDENVDVDICRVCRCEAAPDRPLFYPCVCTGSIKYIHQECLVQWLKYSKKEYCELCKHKFAFAPIYHPDMPKRLPVKDIVTGLAKTILKAIKFWLHSTLVAISWLAIVPLTACRIYRCLFAGSVSSLLTLPLDMLSTENIIVDILQGCFVVLCSLAAFISLVWLREQILSGGGPEWLNQNEMALAAERAPPQPPPRLNLLRPNNQPQQQAADLDVNNQADEERPPVELNHPDPAVRNIGAAPVPPQLNNNNNNNPQIGGIGAAADDNHWNPMEWDRAAEDLTWDRLLGLDGSLLFLEHVFWVISLNTLFILVFAFCPYHLGHYMVYGFRLQKGLEKTHFEGLITTIAGYCLLASGLITVYALLAFSTFHRARKIIGLCYIVIKVAILVVFEICVFPLVCGLWIDACTLRLFNATLTERTASFEQSPGTSVFIHWLVGMIYVFYFATFVFLLKEVFRPGLLWFLRNLNDPDFNPIQEMIQLPVYRHIRRFVTTVTIFGFTIVLLFLVPIKLICMAQQSLLADASFLSTSNLTVDTVVVETLETTTSSSGDDLSFVFSPVVPYNVAQNSETLSTEMSIEVLWLHAALPAILEQSHVRIWAKNLLWLWAVCVSFVLNLRSYLLGDTEPNGQKNKPPANGGANNEANNNNAVQQQVQVGQNPFQFNVGMAHQALLQNNIPCSNEPYSRPSYFKIRIALLLIVICLSLIGFSTFSLVVPVCLGRWALFQVSGNKKLNELYTVVTGMYLIWISIRLGVILYGWIQMGIQQLVLKFKERVTLFAKASVAMSMLFGLLPLLFGLLFQHIVINPITCNHDQSPVLSFWQVWALGVLHTKIATALVLTGPQWWLRHAVERVCQEGLRNLNLRFMFFNLVYPVVVCLGTTLAVPHILAKSVAPVLISDEHYLNLIERRIYPTSLFIITVTTILMLQVKQFKRLYERIRNDKYLVGQRLINFERNLVPASSSHRSSPTTGHSPNQSNLFAAQPENLHYD